MNFLNAANSTFKSFSVINSSQSYIYLEVNTLCKTNTTQKYNNDPLIPISFKTNQIKLM